MESVTKHYYPELDVVKGIAILLVILGHSFCSFPFNINAGLPPILGEIVRSFQMPVLFIASGFLFHSNDSFKVFIKKKVSRLIIPWITFSIITVLLRFIFGSFTQSGNINLLDATLDIVQGHYYWFLYALMIIMIVCRVVNNRAVLIGLALLSILFCLTTEIKNVHVFEIGRIVYFFPYFYIGVLVRQNYERFLTLNLRSHIIIIMALAVLYIASMLIYENSEFVSFYIAALSGSLLTWGIAVMLRHKRMSLLKHFGHYSLQYYLNHLLIMLPVYYMVMFIPIPPLLQLLTIWVTGTFLSFIMLKIEMRSKILRLLCGLN
jgi:fucose 4-O-acetylase-like acetyltransferase